MKKRRFELKHSSRTLYYILWALPRPEFRQFYRLELRGKNYHRYACLYGRPGPQISSNSSNISDGVKLPCISQYLAMPRLDLELRLLCVNETLDSRFKEALKQLRYNIYL
eukprot:6193247-Pleurochrysis_carterae.AAC.5